MRRFFPILLVVLLAVSTIVLPKKVMAQDEGLELENLKVSVWPEYDQPSSALVIFQGEVKESTKLPATVKFIFPKRARLSSTSSVDSKNQFQYDKEWNSRKLSEKGDLVELTYSIYYPRFQFEIYDPISTEQSQRDYSYPLKLALTVKNLEVEVQQPLKSSKFELRPPTSDTTTDKEGFKHFKYNLGAVTPDKEFDVILKYVRSDSKPSVGEGPQTVDTTSGKTKTNPWIAAVIILALLAIPATVYFISLNQRKKPVGAKTAKKKAPAKGANFCPNCGAKLPAGAQFCPSCGHKNL